MYVVYIITAFRTRIAQVVGWTETRVRGLKAFCFGSSAELIPARFIARLNPVARAKRYCRCKTLGVAKLLAPASIIPRCAARFRSTCEMKRMHFHPARRCVSQAPTASRGISESAAPRLARVVERKRSPVRVAGNASGVVLIIAN